MEIASTSARPGHHTLRLWDATPGHTFECAITIAFLPVIQIPIPSIPLPTLAYGDGTPVATHGDFWRYICAEGLFCVRSRVLRLRGNDLWPTPEADGTPCRRRA